MIKVYRQKNRYDSRREGPYKLINTVIAPQTATEPSQVVFVVLDEMNNKFIHFPIAEAVYLNPLEEAMREND